MSRWTRVVVGVDASEPSRRALRWAYDEAREHGAELMVASAWSPAPMVDVGYGAALWTREDEPAETVREVLNRTVAEVIGDEGSGHLRTVVAPGNPAKVLIDLSADADLLVVGSRGHGGFAGLLLGSVSQHVVGHATCAVVVVR